MVVLKDSTNDLNDPVRFYEIRSTLQKKASLKAFYQDVYHKYANSIEKSPSDGYILEIGSGAGFAKEIIPQIITSDAVAYPNIDRVMNATQLDFPDTSLSCICMFNVLHHIPDVRAFFKEAIRCLVPQGRIFMVEPYAGWISSFVLRYLHHEGFDKDVKDWEFTSKGPVSDANNALPTVIFERDIALFRQEFAELSLLQFNPHTPLRYWMTGGLKKWSLLPRWAENLSRWVDVKLIQVSPKFGSFIDIELVKV
jgi:SAM-dependent methyltransferase